MYFDETAWVAIAFLLFFVLVWKKGKKAILSLLDERSLLIEKELNEAKSLKEEALEELRLTLQNQKNKLFHHPYQVTDLSNRMGLRLIGNAINTKKENEITTAGIPLGAIQIPGDGQPIISFVEHQTTGGYPIIANVISADLRKVGQLKPGDCFQFELTSFSTAEKLKVDQEKFIHSLHHD